MEKLKLTTEKALLLNDRTLEVNEGGENIKYYISTSTWKENGVRVLAEMVVDGYVDGEWEHEMSCAYHLGDVIETKNDDWLKLI